MIPIHHGIPCEGLVPFIKLYLKGKRNGYCVKLENNFWIHLDPQEDKWVLNISQGDNNFPSTFSTLQKVEKYGQVYLQGFFGLSMLTAFIEEKVATLYFSNSYPKSEDL